MAWAQIHGLSTFPCLLDPCHPLSDLREGGLGLGEGVEGHQVLPERLAVDESTEKEGSAGDHAGCRLTSCQDPHTPGLTLSLRSVRGTMLPSGEQRETQLPRTPLWPWSAAEPRPGPIHWSALSPASPAPPLHLLPAAKPSSHPGPSWKRENEDRERVTSCGEQTLPPAWGSG